MKKYQSVEAVVEAFETACRAAGLSRNTRRGYTATVEDFTTLLKNRQITGPGSEQHNNAARASAAILGLAKIVEK